MKTLSKCNLLSSIDDIITLAIYLDDKVVNKFFRQAFKLNKYRQKCLLEFTIRSVLTHSLVIFHTNAMVAELKRQSYSIILSLMFMAICQTR